MISLTRAAQVPGNEVSPDVLFSGFRVHVFRGGRALSGCRAGACGRRRDVLTFRRFRAFRQRFIDALRRVAGPIVLA